MADANNNSDDLRARALALLLDVRAQLSDVQAMMNSSTGSAELHAQLHQADASLSGVENQLTQALASKSFPLSLTELMMLSRTVQTANVATLATEAATGSAADRGQVLAAVDTVTGATVRRFEDDLFTRHIFDSFLHFDSEEDKAAYRAREGERQRYISGQLAHHTPQGNLNAAGAETGQMLDAHAHGAGESPEFASRWDELTATIHRQHEAMVAAGQSTEEYDRNIRDDVRRFLKTERHMTDDEIDAKLAPPADPIDVVKPYLETKASTNRLEEDIRYASRDPASKSEMAALSITPQSVPPSPALQNLDTVTADLKAAGIIMADATNTGHGLAPRKSERSLTGNAPAQ